MPQIPGKLFPMIVGPILEELSKSKLLAGTVRFSDLDVGGKEIAVTTVNEQLAEMKKLGLVANVPDPSPDRIAGFKDNNSEIYAVITFLGYEYLAQYRTLFQK